MNLYVPTDLQVMQPVPVLRGLGLADGFLTSISCFLLSFSFPFPLAMEMMHIYICHYDSKNYSDLFSCFCK